MISHSIVHVCLHQHEGNSLLVNKAHELESNGSYGPVSMLLSLTLTPKKYPPSSPRWPFTDKLFVKIIKMKVSETTRVREFNSVISDDPAQRLCER